jgi:FixJ family two-component response regulator
LIGYLRQVIGDLQQDAQHEMPYDSNMASKIILLDDDASVLVSMERVLKAHGFQTQAFDDVEQFLEGAHFDDATCLVLDINLGAKSGVDLRRQLTSTGNSVPVIFITGGDSKITRDAALQAGCVAYLNKPFPSSLLLEAIEAAHKERR